MYKYTCMYLLYIHVHVHRYMKSHVPSMLAKGLETINKQTSIEK